jgi:hypothetical protein
MSTFGKAADQAWADKRRYERGLADKRIRLSHAIRFAIDTLRDSSIADVKARSLALRTLVNWYSLDDLDAVCADLEGRLAA